MMKVLFFTCAYNAEKTLRRAMDSIVNQTHNNWVYYVLDNGSTDGTGDIIQEYSERDSRIHGLSVPENNPLNLFSPPFRKSNLLPDIEYDWMATLDADDEYAPQFAEKCLKYASDNELDLVCTSTIRTPFQIISGMEEDTVFSTPDDYVDFPTWNKHFFPAWSKLYHCSIVKKMKKERINYFDGEVSMEAMLRCSKMGVLSEVLHYKHCIGKKHRDLKTCDNYAEEFITSVPDDILHVGRRFFYEKCGMLTKRSDDMLLYIASDQARSFMDMIFSQKSPFWQEKRFYYIEKLMKSDLLNELLHKEDYGSEMREPQILIDQRRGLLLNIASKVCGNQEIDAVLLPLLYNKINNRL